MENKKHINIYYYKLCIFEYLRLSNLDQKQFEDYLREKITGNEYADVSNVITFFQKEIFPLKRETVQWCMNYFDRNADHINLATILEKIK